MLLCKGNRIYTGYATDVQKRFEAHQAGKGAKFTKAFPPQKILKVFELETKHDAMRLESLIKQKSLEIKKECIRLPEGTLPPFFTDP
ncbi:MAG: GIY-YIG nuclease family protein [Fibrobacter sp.]|nr:GIY-YIG nuclease family protein [Fibrobacter sp.]